MRGASQTAATPAVVTRAESLQEIEEKLACIQKFLAAENLGGVLLTRVSNFSWITAGLADNHIVLTSELGAASLLIMRDGRKCLIASNSEVPRLMAEDLKDLGYEAKMYLWYEDKVTRDRKLQIIREIAGGQEIGSDAPYADLRVVAAPLARLRYQLTAAEIKKYRWLGRETTEAVVAICRRLRPGLSEREIEAWASDELMRRGLRPTVLLMGVDERVFNYYHHTPSDARLRKYAIVNVCARKWGLVISVARFVHFGPLPAELERRLRAAAEISARFQASSRPGTRAVELLEMAKQWYAEQGFEGDWTRHHQGGAIGYAEREWVAHPGSTEIVQARQAFAWNPIVRGALSFDTIIVYDDHIENLTATPGWPTIPVTVQGKTYAMPDILVR